MRSVLRPAARHSLGTRWPRRAPAVAGAALLATLLSTAPARAVIGAHPPGRADRRGLLRAYPHHNRSGSGQKLVGFRVWESDPAGAAYVLKAGPGGTYRGGETELFERGGGHHWRFVRHLKNQQPGFNDVEALHPGFRWRVTSVGTGNFEARATSVEGEGEEGSVVTTETASARLAWSLSFNDGHPVELRPEGYGFAARPGLSGTAGSQFTRSAPEEPTESSSCGGAVADRSSTRPRLLIKERPDARKSRSLAFDLYLAPAPNSRVTWGNCGGGLFPGVERLVADARDARASTFLIDAFNDGLTRAPASFQVALDGSDPEAAKEVEPRVDESGGFGVVVSNREESLVLAGTLRFKLAGLWMPLGWFSTPHPPLPSDGHAAVVAAGG